MVHANISLKSHGNVGTLGIVKQLRLSRLSVLGNVFPHYRVVVSYEKLLPDVPVSTVGDIFSGGVCSLLCLFCQCVYRAVFVSDVHVQQDSSC